MRASIARGQDVNEASGRGYGNSTGLMRAVADSNNDIVKLLLEQPNVDLNSTTVNGQTALHEAAVNDNFQGVKQLLADLVSTMPIIRTTVAVHQRCVP